MSEPEIQAFVRDKCGTASCIEDDREEHFVLGVVREACEKERTALFAWLEEEYGHDDDPGAWRKAWERDQSHKLELKMDGLTYTMSCSCGWQSSTLQVGGHSRAWQQHIQEWEKAQGGV